MVYGKNYGISDVGCLYVLCCFFLEVFYMINNGENKFMFYDQGVLVYIFYDVQVVINNYFRKIG